MSDGNFNRSLLPHTPYHSGLQAGKAMARMQAVKAFKNYLARQNPSMAVADMEEQAALFKKILSAYL